MKAFIFSLDSFVAFTLALVAIYTLIFFSAIPSSYYYLLTQGQYLAKDSLYSLSTSDCTYQFSCGLPHSSLLDNLVFAADSGSTPDPTNIAKSIGAVVPKQFGYVLEVSQDNGATWTSLYDTSSSGDGHASVKRKLSVSSQVVVFRENTPDLVKNQPDPYVYETCGRSAANGPVLTCSNAPSNPPSGGPGAGAGQYVPYPSFRLVRLTIFI